MSEVIAYMLNRELNYRLMKNKWFLPGKHIFPVTVWTVSDWADDGRWRYHES